MIATRKKVKRLNRPRHERCRLRLESLEPRLLLALSDVPITSGQKMTMLDGLAGWVEWADVLDQFGDVGALLPTVGQPLGTAVDLGGTLKIAVVDPIDAYFAVDVTPTTGELVAALAALDGDVYPGLSIAVDSMSVSGGHDDIAGDEELVFSLTLVATRSFATHPSLGMKGEALGLAFDTTFGATGTMTLDFSFGMDLSGGLDPEDAFFVRIDDWDATVAASPTFSGTSTMRAGFLDATLTGGSMSLGAALDVDVANPDSDAQGDLTLAELDPEELVSMISTATSGTAAGSVSFTGSSFAGFTPAGTATASFSTSDPFAAPDITFSAEFEPLRPFTNLTATSLLGVLSQLGVSLDFLGDASPFGQALHVTGEKSFGEVLKLGRLLTDPAAGLIELLSPGPDVTPIFNSAQSLATALASVLGLPAGTNAPAYDSASHELSYHVELSHVFAAEMLDVGFDIDLGSLLGITTSSQVAATVTGDLEFTIGVDLETLQARLVPSAASPADGKLTGDAIFSLSIAAASPMPVSVTAAATADNTSLADLAADFNAALIAAGISSAVAAAVDGDKLILHTFGDLPIESLKLTAAAGNAILTELHFADKQLAVDTVGHHVFLEDVLGDASVSLSASDIDATAKFGFLSVGVASGTASGSFGAEFALKNPGTGAVGGRIFLPQILQAVGGDVATLVDGPDLSGTLSATLPISATILGSPVGGSPTVTISWPDVTSGSPSVMFTSFSELDAFKDVGEGDVLG
ncbi:MAG: hypothetical protein WD176_06750, partial [Pirellulales bacterium]